MTTKTYKDKNQFGISLTIQYIDKIESVINLPTLNLFFQDIYENTRRYMGSKVLDGLDLEIWDDLCENLPKNVTVCDPKTKECKITSYGVGNYAGLTWASINQMDLNDNLFGQPEWKRHEHMSNLLSHEIGHYIAYKIFKFDREDNPLKDFWLKFRGVDQKPSTSIGELIAEDIRFFFGSRLAKLFKRGDYIQASDKVGLESLYKLWAPALYEYDFYKQHCRISQFNVEFVGDKKDKCFITFYIDYNNIFWKFSNRYIAIDENGIYTRSNKNKSWELKRRI